MRHVLVTGGAGYVGSHACRALAKAGYLPVALDNLSTGHRWAVRWGPLEIGDVADHKTVSAVMAKYRPLAVMHFAALSLVGESASQPGRYYDNNVSGTLTLLQAMRSAGIERFIFSSTCATYGQPDSCPIAETARQQPINTYGRSKLMVETILRDFATAYGLHAIALRYFNAAGAAANDGIGEAHPCETHLIPLVIEAALGRRGPVQIFGTDYATPDGTCQRDYIHVNDLADAHVRALELSAQQSGFQAFNLGTGRPYSVREIVAAVEARAGRAVPQQLGPRRPGDPDALFADPARARAALGWQARESDLDNIIGSAWAWHASLAGAVSEREVRLAV
ncbi:UDP-arabinose 4-epimerase [Dongia mobilis]|uniref:UDP-glucose 4-epimerase n=1 Tax=Dongia mobilis TaxID=578943 RepID=A0A4R6WTJ7_9PROT|nr:UDP-glucose 4-epimerase GalE [Dongia mobilis]TDQ83368.1 UDP-arabinose 4-epimerase [Dongia mobilis]